MPEERRLDQVVLKVDGNPLATDLHARMSLVRVEESVYLPDLFVLRFDDPHFKLFDSVRFTMGTKVEIAFSAEGELTIVTRGEVTAISVEQGASGVHELVVQGMDVTHRLSRGVKTRSFLQMTDSDIAGKIAAEYGFDPEIDGTPEVYDYVLQSSQTDYAFLKQRAGRIGFDLWIADGRFYFKPAPKAAANPPVLRWGANLHKFKVRFSSAERCDEVTVRGWDPVAKTAIVGRATEGDAGSTAPAVKDLADSARQKFGEVKRFAGQHPVRTQREADALAGSLLLRASGEEVIARGEATGDPMIAAGALVNLEAIGEKLAGAYRVTTVEHMYGAGSPYVTRFVCGGKEPGGLVELLGAGNGASASSNGGQGWGGLVVGVVTNNDDDQSLARVKVKFPTLTETDESTWAKLLAPGGGAERGLQCLPEVGDEVLVGFEHGDLQRPVVFGGLWNKNDPPPESAVKGGQVMARSWTSRNGHKLRLSDESEGAVTVTLGDGDSKLSVTRSDTKLTGEQKLTLEGKEVEVRATGKLLLKGASVEIAGDGDVKVTGAIIQLN